MKKRIRIIAITAALLGLSALAAPQLKEVIKILGVGAAVKQFGPQLNTGLNKLTHHTDTVAKSTKVVPIITIGLGKNSYIGAAQVMGPKKLIDKVEAVAAPEMDLFGKEIRIRALIPVATKDVVKDIKPVDGVAVSGIVDLKL